MFSHQYLRKVAIWKIKSGFFTLVCFWQVDKLSGCSAPTNTWTSSGTHLCHGIWELYFVIVVAALKAEALSGGHKLCSRFLVNVFLPHFFLFLRCLCTAVLHACYAAQERNVAPKVRSAAWNSRQRNARLFTSAGPMFRDLSLLKFSTEGSGSELVLFFLLACCSFYDRDEVSIDL